MSGANMIPFNDLPERLNRHRDSIRKAFDRVMRSGSLILGHEVDNFEKKFAEWVGVAYCVGVANGTDAIEIALRAGGVSDQDAVATVANAGMYALTAIEAIGASPVFMDVSSSHLSAGLAEVQKAISEGVRAVIVTHLYGAICPEIEAIADFCQRSGILLVEDCAHAHGAVLNGQKAGSFGDCASFSFYPTKNLGAVGDGGAIATSNEEIAARARGLRQYGWKFRYCAGLSGGRNSRLDEIQAAVLSDMLPSVDADNEARRSVASAYLNAITNREMQMPDWRGVESVYHLFVVRTGKRKLLQAELTAGGIGHSVHYPIPDHRQPIFSERFAHVSLPETEKACEEIVSLPCYPNMKSTAVGAVIDAVNRWRP
jgi:dTDP-4-amino-4,6-dideoxygalactose transaminase